MEDIFNTYLISLETTLHIIAWEMLGLFFLAEGHAIFKTLPASKLQFVSRSSSEFVLTCQ